jgi:3-oxoacyl-[acyl-carrier protein] reductase
MTTRVALITGGAKGIGKAIALRLAKERWSIALCYRTSEEAASATSDEIRKLGAKVLAVRADVADPQQCLTLVERVFAEWGRLDALVNAAGPYHRVPILEETPEGWRSMFDNNLHHIFYLSRLVGPIMQRQKWGRILSFGMANAERLSAQPGVTAHYAAKVGVIVLSRALAKELAPHGITVNVISPGFIDSGSAPDDELQKMLKNIPAGYLGATSDAASAAHFLLSDEARYVTGTNLMLSGGWGI